MMGFEVWKLGDNISKYEECIKNCRDVSPYHLAEYLLAEECAEDGETIIFAYSNKNGVALFPGVLRPIRKLRHMEDVAKDYADLMTPHEYGGVIASTDSMEIRKELIRGILQYCHENHIVFQFVRINPFFSELPLLYQEEGFEVVHSNAQVYVDLMQTEEQLVESYKANTRRNVRNARKMGLTFQAADKNRENTKIFYSMYQDAMKILDAKRFLYFNERYFVKLMEAECSRLFFVCNQEGSVAAASIGLVYGKKLYYHLGCFDRQYSAQRPMNYLFHSMILWGRREGHEVLHLGGGMESLVRFKGGYSPKWIDYYIAYQVCDNEKYQELCDVWKKRFPQCAGESFYPLYRYNE